MSSLKTIGLIIFLCCVSNSETQSARTNKEQPSALTEPFFSLDSNSVVRRVQRALKDAGLYVGKINGKVNQETKNAIIEYQRREGLPLNPIVSTELAVTIETITKVKLLLKQLRDQREKKIEEAKKALLAREETRDLIHDKEEKKLSAKPERNSKKCFNNPSAKCLLDEALANAIGIYKTELRDWVLGEILVVQAKAGLTQDAIKTIQQIGDPRLILVALRDIAEALASVGKSVDALNAAEIIPDSQKRLDAYNAIADTMASRGFFKKAISLSLKVFENLFEINDPLKRISLACKSAIILAKSGEITLAEKKLNKIREDLPKDLSPDQYRSFLHSIANAFAEMGKPDDALIIIKDLPNEAEHSSILISAATAQAKAGNSQQAILTADNIHEVRYRAIVLTRIAVAQSKSGQNEKSRKTINRALEDAKKIKLTFARAFAYKHISLALIKISKYSGSKHFELAIKTATLISDDKIRAKTLWSLYSESMAINNYQSQEKLFQMAEQATSEIKSAFTRVWMFTEIAIEHFSAKREAQAKKVLKRALKITLNIESPWSRSRALVRLSRAFVELLQKN